MSEYGWDSYGADYGDDWAERQAEEIHRMQARRMSYLYGEQAPYPDGLRPPRMPPPEGSPGQVMDAWMDRTGRFPSPPGARELARARQRDAIEAGNREYELAREITGMELEDRLDGAAARRMLAVSRNDDGSPADLGDMHARVTEFRAQWQQDGTSQVRTGWR